MNENFLAYGLIASWIIKWIEASPMSRHDKQSTHRQMMDGLDEAYSSGEDLWETYYRLKEMEKSQGITPQTGGEKLTFF